MHYKFAIISFEDEGAHEDSKEYYENIFKSIKDVSDAKLISDDDTSTFAYWAAKGELKNILFKKMMEFIKEQ